MRKYVESTLKSGILETLVNGGPISTPYFPDTIQVLKTHTGFIFEMHTLGKWGMAG